MNWTEWLIIYKLYKLKAFCAAKRLYFCRSAIGFVWHDSADSYLLPAAILSLLLKHCHHSFHCRVAHNARVSLRVLQRGGRAARHSGREVHRFARDAHNVHRYAEQPAPLAVQPVLIARWSGWRSADAALDRFTSRREAPHFATCGTLQSFTLFWTAFRMSILCTCLVHFKPRYQLHGAKLKEHSIKISIN